MFVYITGYGLRPFRAKEISMFNKDKEHTQLKGEYKLPKGTTTAEGKKWVRFDYWFTLGEIHIRSFSTINTVLYKSGDNISCHSVGINGCDKIIETPCRYTNHPCYSYTAAYEDGKNILINNVILATDQKLS